MKPPSKTLAKLHTIKAWLDSVCIYELSLMDIRMMLVAATSHDHTVDSARFSLAYHAKGHLAAACFIAWAARVEKKNSWVFRIRRPKRGQGLITATITPDGLRLLGLDPASPPPPKLTLAPPPQRPAPAFGTTTTCCTSVTQTFLSAERDADIPVCRA